MSIYLVLNQKEQGPFLIDQVKELLASGQVTGTDLAWREGMQSWQPVATLPEFASMFQIVKKPRKLSQNTLLPLILAGGLVFWGAIYMVIRNGSQPKSAIPQAGIQSSSNIVGISSGKTDSFQKINVSSLPVTLQELNRWYEQPPAGENAASTILDACEQMRIDGNTITALMPILRKGKMPTESMTLDASVRQTLRTIVQENAAALDLLFQGTKCTRSRYPIDLTQGLNTLLPHLAKIKKAAQLAAFAAVFHADSRQSEHAGQMILAGVGIAQSLEYEPLLISQLVRIACVEICISALEQVLNRAVLPKECLDRLQKAVNLAEEQESHGAGFTRAMAGERVMGLTFFDNLSEMLKNPEELKKKLSLAMSESPVETQNQMLNNLKHHSKEDRIFMEKTFNMYFAFRSKPFPDRLEAIDFEKNTLTQLARQSQTLPFCSSRLPALQGATKKEAKQLSKLRFAKVAIALERYRLRNRNQYPDSLQALKPEFLEEIPSDPYTGKDLQYLRIGQGYKIESTGPTDGSDSTSSGLNSGFSFSVIYPPSNG